jgi:hypothetical protein
MRTPKMQGEKKPGGTGKKISREGREATRRSKFYNLNEVVPQSLRLPVNGLPWVNVSNGYNLEEVVAFRPSYVSHNLFEVGK